MFKRIWFQPSPWIIAVLLVFGFMLANPIRTPAFAQVVATNTLGGPSPFITVTYIEPVNIRSGPSTVFYPIIGQLPVGATAPALGTDPSHTWIQISYSGSSTGVGWVYATNVTLTGALQIIEPPPTLTPLVTSTIDPTLAAAYNVIPTETRLPTFTPPAATAIVPTFTDAPVSPKSFPMGFVIIGLALAGGLVLVASLFVRR